MQQVLKKNQNFQQNDENIMFLAKTNGSDSVWWSKRWWSRSSPSTPTKLGQSYSLSWVDISFGNVRQFWFLYCLKLMNTLFYIYIC